MGEIKGENKGELIKKSEPVIRPSMQPEISRGTLLIVFFEFPLFLIQFSKNDSPLGFMIVVIYQKSGCEGVNDGM